MITVITYRDMDQILQWTGTALILLGQILTSVGPETWPWNLFAMFLGSALFLIWAIRVRINSLIVVNAASIVVMGSGVVNGIVSLING